MSLKAFPLLLTIVRFNDDLSLRFPLKVLSETSNQACITAELLKPCNQVLFKELVTKYGDQGWEKVYDMAVCPIPLPILFGCTALTKF